MLNVGPTASGEIPELQQRSMEQLADWMQVNRIPIHDTRPLPADVTSAFHTLGRWTGAGATAYLVLDADGQVRLAA